MVSGQDQINVCKRFTTSQDCNAHRRTACPDLRSQCELCRYALKHPHALQDDYLRRDCICANSKSEHIYIKKD